MLQKSFIHITVGKILDEYFESKTHSSMIILKYNFYMEASEPK